MSQSRSSRTWQVPSILAVLFVCFLSSGPGRAAAQPADLAAAQSRVFQFNQAGDYRQALEWAERALLLAQRNHGPQSLEAANAHLAIAIQNQSLGQLPPAAEHFRRGLAIAEQRVPVDDPSLASFLAGLGGMLYGQGRYDEAEPHLRRSLRLQEAVARQTGNEAGLAAAIYMLGTNYTAMSSLEEGSKLLERALAIFERLAPQGSPQTALVLNNLATNRQLANDYLAAAQYQQRALTIFQAFAPENLPGLAKINNNLGFLHAKAGILDKAAGYYRDALAQLRRAYPAGHPDVATASINYGGLLLGLERSGEAEPLLTGALAMRKRWLPPDHPEIAQANAELANLWIRRGDWRRASEHLRGAVDIFVTRAARQDSGRGSAANNDVVQNAFAFSMFVKTEHRRAPSEVGAAFAIAQHAVGSSAASSLAQMATRSAAGDPRLSGLVRARQDLVAQWHALDRELVATLSKPTPQEGPSDSLRQHLAVFDTQITELDRTIAAQFPDFIALANPAPLNIPDVQADLAPDEALVLFLDTPAYLQLPEETFVWIVTKTAVRKTRSDLGTAALTREVSALRCGLDKTAWYGEGATRCAAHVGVPLDQAPVEGQPLPFDHARAHKLFMSLLGPAQDLIRNKHLLIVPSGPLTQLPFQVLVTKPPTGDDHRAVAWLARDHAMTILPAAASLRSLRRVGRPSSAPRQMIGFGNPLLDGPDPRYTRSAALARDRQRCPDVRWQQAQTLAVPRSAAAAVTTHNGLAVRDHLRIQVPLPETADELCAVAQDMKADPADIHLGAHATERALKRLSASGELARYRMVHFATHGLLAGQLDGTSEPGLILSPPDVATAEDDGYLSASEIATLKLDADLVILSACNTAAGAATSSEALSGLARAFIYAQARALLVSHWEVYSDATVKLITTAVREMARDPKVGRAEAMRRSMVALIDNGARHEGHPAYWAPFVVVGEGGIRKPS
ncbi:MAG: CHAT domain-containing protein [Hyphomicrobiaceae bacterium]